MAAGAWSARSGPQRGVAKIPAGAGLSCLASALSAAAATAGSGGAAVGGPAAAGMARGAGGASSASAISLMAQCSLQAIALAGFTVRFVLVPRLLQAQQQPERGVRLAHHRHRLGAAFRGPFGRRFRELGEAKTVLPLLRGGDELRGHIGLGGIGRAEAGDAGDGGVIAPEQNPRRCRRAVAAA